MSTLTWDCPSWKSKAPEVGRDGVIEPNQPVGGEFERSGNQSFGLKPGVVHARGHRRVGDIDRVDGGERRQGGENPEYRDDNKAVRGWSILKFRRGIKGS